MPLTPLCRRLLRTIAPAAMLCLAAGCSYKSEIRQGDDTLPDKIAALQTGMTREEVRELLGENRTPAVFAGDEWVYYYRRRTPGFFPQTRAWGVALVFEGEVLADIRPLTDAANAAAE